MKNGNLVAIKRLNRGPTEEMTIDFLSELGIVVHVDHPNIAKLIGYGVEGGLHLVLQLSPHGSLASLLNGSFSPPPPPQPPQSSFKFYFLQKFLIQLIAMHIYISRLKGEIELENQIQDCFRGC